MIFLAQSDTTAGFFAQDAQILNVAKNRSQDALVLREVANFCALKKLVRVPAAHKNLIRRAKKTTFVYAKNEAIRVNSDEFCADFLQKFSFIFATSANQNGYDFCYDFALQICDVAVVDSRGLRGSEGSWILKLGAKNLKILRKNRGKNAR